MFQHKSILWYYQWRGGWLVVRRRQDGSFDFNKVWVDYEDGFGSLTGEFWYGLTPLHCLTNQGQWEMRIDFTLTDGTKSYLSYSSFKLESASSSHQLSISRYNRIFSDLTAGPHSQNGIPFTTKDKDNDQWDENWAVKDGGGNAGGWWYYRCTMYMFINTNCSGYKLPQIRFTEIKINPFMHVH